MTNSESPLWIERDPEDEEQVIQRYTEVIFEVLAELGENDKYVCNVSFDRIIEEEDHQTITPGEHTGRLVGLCTKMGELAIILSDYVVHLYEFDEDLEAFTFEATLEQSEIAIIPIREINELYIATSTSTTWDYLARNDDNG